MAGAYRLVLVVLGIVENVRQEVLGGNVQSLGGFEDHDYFVHSIESKLMIEKENEVSMFYR